MGDMAEKLFHIDGLNNPADLVTKQNNIYIYKHLFHPKEQFYIS